MKMLLKLFLCLALVILLPIHANSSEASESKIEKLRQQQKADLDRIKDEYDNRARKEVPRRKDGTLDTDSQQYKDLEDKYTNQRNKVQNEYKSKDPRTADFESKNEIKGVKNTGSAPKDVRADADWAAESPEAVEAKTDQWKKRKDVLVDEGHKIVNKTTDETLWKPGYKPGDKGLVSDGDAHGTQGGIEKVTRTEGKKGFEKSGDGIRDPEGVALDNEKKFIDAQKRANLKDQSKTVVKSGDSTGRSADPAQKDLYETARGQKNYGDEITSGVSDLGDDPDVRAKKVADYQKNLDAEMRHNVAEGQKQGETLDNQRKQIADSARKTETSGDKAWNDAKNKANYGETRTTSEEIDTRRQKVADSNRATAEANQKARADLESSGGKVPDADTPDGKPRGPATDAPEGKFGKAVDKVGKGMQAVDILSGAQDFKEAAKKGDVEGMGKAAVNTADGLTGGVKGTVDTLVTKGSDRAAAQNDIEQANRTNLENQNQRIANDLQRAKMDKDEIKSILDAKAHGDEGPLRDSYEKLGKPIPNLVVEKPVKGDDTVIDRTKEVATGVGEKVVKAGKFVKETGEDVGEIATGLTEKGVAREVIKQQKENLSPSNIGDGLEAITDTRNAGLINAQARNSLADKLVEKGASREDAAKAAEAWSKGDHSQLDGLKDKLGLPGANPKADGKGQDGKQKLNAGTKKTVGAGATAGTGDKGMSGAKEPGTSDSSAFEGAEAKGGADAVTKTGEPVPWGARNDAGTAVNPGVYEGGDKIINKDGVEYENKNGQWVETGEKYGAYKPDQDSLKGQEPSAGESAAGSTSGPGAGSGSLLGQYADQNKADTQQKTGDAIITMGQNSQLGEAANVGNQQARDAKNIQDSAGRDAETTQTESTQKTAQVDSKNSLGNEIGDAIEKGITEGGQAFGGVIGGAAADKVADDIFGDPHKGGNSSGGHDHEGTQVASAGGVSGSDGAAGGDSAGRKGGGADMGKGAGKRNVHGGDKVSGTGGKGPAVEGEPGAGVDDGSAAEGETGAGDDEGPAVEGGTDTGKAEGSPPATEPSSPPATEVVPDTPPEPPESLLEQFYQMGLADGREQRECSENINKSEPCKKTSWHCQYETQPAKWHDALCDKWWKGLHEGEGQGY